MCWLIFETVVSLLFYFQLCTLVESMKKKKNFRPDGPEIQLQVFHDNPYVHVKTAIWQLVSSNLP